MHALALFEQVLVHGAHDVGDGQVFFDDELAHLLEAGRVFQQGFLGGHFRGAAGHDALHMGHAAAEEGDHLMGDAAHFQGFQVLVHAHLVGFGGQAQVGLGETRHEGRGIGAGHEVQSGQMVEVQDVRLQVVGAQDQVAGDTAVAGHLDVEGVFLRQGGSHGMGGGAHAADALHDLGGVTRVAPFQNLFKTAEHPTGEVGVHNLAVLHHHLGLEMALDSGDGIDGDSGLGHKALL